MARASTKISTLVLSVKLKRPSLNSPVDPKTKCHSVLYHSVLYRSKLYRSVLFSKPLLTHTISRAAKAFCALTLTRSASSCENIPLWSYPRHDRQRKSLLIQRIGTDTNWYLTISVNFAFKMRKDIFFFALWKCYGCVSYNTPLHSMLSLFWHYQSWIANTT